MAPFEPLLRSPHLQTLAGHFWRRPDRDAEFPIQRRLYRTEPDVQVLVCSQRPHGESRGEIFMVHGLEGSGEAGYIRSLSAAALRSDSRRIVFICAPAGVRNISARPSTMQA